MRLLEIVQRVAVLGEDDQLLMRRWRRIGQSAPCRVGGGSSSATRFAIAAGVKISLKQVRQLPPLPVLAAAPDRRVRVLRGASAFRSPPRSSAIVRAAVAWSRICSSAASTSSSGASSRSSTSSSSSSRRLRSKTSAGDLAAALEQLQLAQAAFKPFPAAAQRLVDRLGRRSEAALQNRQREADRAGALVILKRLGAVELLADVIGDRLVESRPRRRRACRGRCGRCAPGRAASRRTSAGSP